MQQDHIFEYLKNYIETPFPPEFAIMINGDWGSGKTFNIKRYIKSFEDENKKVIYISLYGIKNIEELHHTFFLKASLNYLNHKNNKLLKALQERFKIKNQKSNLVEDIFYNYGLKLQINPANIIDASSVDLIVFDDLERCQLDIKETLGFINQFVEHNEMRVVIVANEEELLEKKHYRKTKEKVVGQTFKMIFHEEAATKHFISEITKDECKDFLINNIKHLIITFQQSDTKNLRLLKQTIAAWAQLYKHIDHKIRMNEESMIILLEFFTALSIEMLSGNLQEEDLKYRENKIIYHDFNERHQITSDSERLVNADSKYPKIDFGSKILTDEVLIQTLCHGKFDGTKINQALSNSVHFMPDNKENSWNTVWYHLERTTEEFEEAFIQMENEFTNKKFKIVGEVLHVIDLRIWCSQINQLEKTENEVKDECIKYIDHLYKNDFILTGPETIDWSNDEKSELGKFFMSRDNPVFKDIFEYYQEQYVLAEKEKWPQYVDEVLQDLNENIYSFHAKICTKDESINSYAKIPIFSVAFPEDFTKILINQTHSNFRFAMKALHARYPFNTLKEELKSELGWLKTLRDQLINEAENQRPIKRYIIRNSVKYNLDSLLDIKNEK